MTTTAMYIGLALLVAGIVALIVRRCIRYLLRDDAEQDIESND